MFKIEKTFKGYVRMFKEVSRELKRPLTIKELDKHIYNLPGSNWFIKNCPDENVKKYTDFLFWLGFKKEKIHTHNKYNYEIAYEIFKEKGLTLLPQEYINDQTKMKFICPNHPNIIQEKSLNSLIYGTSSEKSGCCYCHYESAIGANSNNWKGGISPLNNFLREFLSDWKKESMVNCHYKCVITGDKFDVIHHLYPYNKILQETLDECRLPVYPLISNYTNEQLELLKYTIIKNHYKHPLGVCLRQDIHNLYHHIYGDDNNLEQFEEFAKKYYDGEFDEKLLELKQLKNKKGMPKVRKKRVSNYIRPAKFTYKQASEIREKYSTGKYKQIELAEEYSTVVSVISNIINFKGVYQITNIFIQEKPLIYKGFKNCNFLSLGLERRL